MYITISGAAGSGKSTLAKRLAEELNLERIYVGGIRRKMAQEQGMTLAEFNDWSETHPEGDIDVDKKVKEEALKLDGAIIEGRTQFIFFPDSIKIYIDVDTDEAAERIFMHMKEEERNEDKGLNSTLDVKNSILERKKSDTARYKKYYDINVFDHSHYDLVIDSTDLDIEGVYTKAIEYIKKCSK